MRTRNTWRPSVVGIGKGRLPRDTSGPPDDRCRTNSSLLTTIARPRYGLSGCTALSCREFWLCLWSNGSSLSFLSQKPGRQSDCRDAQRPSDVIPLFRSERKGHETLLVPE